MECPDSQRQSFLLKAREAFAIGLLTKSEGELVTSKQELHTLLKTAYSLTVAQKWLGTPEEVVAQATQSCQKALAIFYDYCHADTEARDSLCAEIMNLVAQVRLLLQVEPFRNSEKGSFIPDSYRNIKDASVNFTLEGFFKVMQRFQKYHASLCKTTNSKCNRTKDEIDGAKLCITALGTTIGTLNTECITETCKVSNDTPKGSNSSVGHPPQKPDVLTTLESTDNLGSSWQNFSFSSSGSPQPSSSGYTGRGAMEHEANAGNLSCLTTEIEDERSDSILQTTDKNKTTNIHGCNSGIGSKTVPRFAIPSTSSSNVSSNSEKFEVIQAGIETLDTVEDWIDDVASVAQKPSVVEGAPQSLSQLSLRTFSSSLSDSFSSQSSWEKISTGLNSPTNRKHPPKAGPCKSSMSPASDRSFFLLETLDSETSDSVQEHLNVHPKIDNEVDSVSIKPDAKNSLVTPQPKLSQCTSTETSTDSSFEMLEENPSEPNEISTTRKVNVPQRKNPSCYSCLKQNTVGSAVPKRQYSLSHQDYQALLAGVCNECLLKRLHSNKTQFKLKEHRTAYSKFEIPLLLQFIFYIKTAL